MKIRVGHSPDADDAFMFYALTFGKIPTGEYQFEHILKDIETLNGWAREKRLEVTALSLHAYAHVSNDYALLRHGASIGEEYGPIVIARDEIPLQELKNKRIAVPGEMTTAFLALRLCLGNFQYGVVPFDQIFDAVMKGEFDAGLIIHEGQITFSQHGLKKILDLGEWWFQKTQLPLPLGVNVVRKDLGVEHCHSISHYLRESIEYALDHRKEAMEYALQYARNTEMDLTDRFVAMYVNEFTRDLGDRGEAAVRALLNEAHQAGLIPAAEPEFID